MNNTGRPKKDRKETVLTAVIGYRLKKARGDVAQWKIANQLKIKESQLSRWENGHNRPNEYYLSKLAKVYGRSRDYLGAADFEERYDDLSDTLWSFLEENATPSYVIGNDYFPAETVFQYFLNNGIVLDRDEFEVWYSAYNAAVFGGLSKFHLAVLEQEKQNEQWENALSQLADSRPVSFQYDMRSAVGETPGEKIAYSDYLEAILKKSLAVWCGNARPKEIADVAKRALESREQRADAYNKFAGVSEEETAKR